MRSMDFGISALMSITIDAAAQGQRELVCTSKALAQFRRRKEKQKRT